MDRVTVLPREDPAVRPTARSQPPPTLPAEADGQATALPGVAPMVLTADCLPVAVVGEGAVAMLHAGWRGLAGGVVAEGVRAVRELGGRRPAGRGDRSRRRAVLLRGRRGGARRVRRPRRRRARGRKLDLPAIARRELESAGVEEVHDGGLCTICSDAALFFSHRRDRGVTGRQAGVAWLS